MEQRKIFSKEEYESRISRLQNLMPQYNLDGVLITQAENLTYFTGYKTSIYNSKFRPFFCIIPTVGVPTLILPVLELGLGKQTSYIEDIRCWGNLPGCQGSEPISLIAKAIKERVKERSRIGIEIDNGQRMGMNMAQFDELKGLMPNVQFVPSSVPIWKLRLTKSKREIEYMREVCRITDKAMEAVTDFTREGKTEKDTAMILGITMLEEGADMPRSLNVSSGVENYCVLNGLGTDRILKRGDMINFDFGGLYKGYCSDITRSLFIGTPSKRQIEFYEAIKQVHELTCRAVRPGLRISEVDKVAEKTITELGYRDYMLHRTGHGLGLEVHEPPSIGPGDDTIIEEGMVLAIEPGIYDFSIGAFRIEDNIVVTSDGFEYLSKWNREIVVK